MTWFRFLVAVMTCLAGALLGGRSNPGGTWAAQVATPSLLATPRALDLAAMTLTPAELGLPGAGLASHDGSSSMVFAEQTLGDGADDALATGWRGSYENGIATIQAVDASLYQESVVVRVHQYGDAASAAQDFNTFMQGLVADGMQVDRGTTTFGDRSAVARWSDSVTDTGEPYQQALIAFQVDALTADVTVYDFTNRSPDAVFLERMAAALLTRIDAELARGGVGLGAQALRLTGDTVATVFDRYERRDGEVLPIAGESGDWLTWRRDAYPGAIDEYRISQSINGGASYYGGRLVAFPDFETASAAIREAPARSAARLSEGAEVLPLLGAESLGDESQTLTYATMTSDGRIIRGFLVVTRVGAVVAEVFVEAEQERPPLTTVQELMRAQIECIRSGACTELAAVPPELGLPASTPTR